MEIILAQPRGFCAGVVRAVEIVELALENYGPPVYVFHEIVHNPHVVSDLRARGAIFVSTLDAVPGGSVTVFSAHGVSNAVVEQAQQLKLQVIDATCPLVTKVHLQAQQYSLKGYETIIIGHPGHEEVEGTVGSVGGPVHVVSNIEDVAALEVADPEKLAYVTQTTLSIDDTRDVIRALEQRFPSVKGPNLRDICYATQNRQNAVRQLAAEVDLLLVVGARNSSNSNRLREVGESQGVPAYLIEDASELNAAWFDGVDKVGITAGASTPEVLVEAVREKLMSLGAVTARELDGVRETVTFRLPRVLEARRAAAGRK
ncbi:MAG TPA: 4-hydroxy-3-methylbut-2-enyl diphosphate reductase [Burkholderiales bacterium]|jgi:4-hydroxy-3-methylbut-2-enyl diphosphate reductase|nr:4-hydroxy-3-methylbut-2-enyl diphosphate reductase [Burkholderiales bacterium]